MSWSESFILLGVFAFFVLVRVMTTPKAKRVAPPSPAELPAAAAEPFVVKPTYAMPAVLCFGAPLMGFAVPVTYFVIDDVQRAYDSMAFVSWFSAAAFAYGISAFRACKRLELHGDHLLWGDLRIRATDIAEIQTTFVFPPIKRAEPIVTLSLRNPRAYQVPWHFYLWRQARADVVLVPSLMATSGTALKEALFARYGAKSRLMAEW